jgi:hypothetical protein
MGKTYRAYLPEQDLLLPPSLREWLPEDHLAYFVSDVVDQLDLSAIESVYEEEERGQPPYHPRMMAKILLYGYCVGVFSSRRIEKKLRVGCGVSGVSGGQRAGFPDDLGFSEAASGGAAGVVRSGATDYAAGGNDEAGASGLRRKQSESQCEQAQSHELWSHAGGRKALKRRGETALGALVKKVVFDEKQFFARVSTSRAGYVGNRKKILN